MTAGIETNLWQGDLETKVDGMKGDLTETERKSNEALFDWEEERQEQSRGSQEQIVAEEDISADDEGFFVALRQHVRMCTEKGLWLACESAGESTGVRAHSPTAMPWFLILDIVMLSLFPSLRQIPNDRERRGPS